MQVALGFRAHSGWAAVVAVAETTGAPRILERRRIVIADPEMPGSKQPYHAAAELPFHEAELLVNAAIESARSLAAEAIAALVKTLQTRGHEVSRCALLRGSGKQLPALDRILAAHPLIHTAEGEMFRDVLEWAARECRLEVTAVREKDLDPAALARLNALGKSIGPPWTQDQKYATSAALLALRAALVTSRS